MTKKYPSKIAYGLLIIIGLIMFGPMIYEFFTNDIDKKLYISFGILMVVALFIAHLFFTTYYTIKDDQLHIKSGILVDGKIDINTIKSVKKTNSILSSPAASFDRIIVFYGKYGEVILSPKNKIGFIKHLQEVNPKIECNFDEL